MFFSEFCDICQKILFTKHHLVSIFVVKDWQGFKKVWSVFQECLCSSLNKCAFDLLNDSQFYLTRFTINVNQVLPIIFLLNKLCCSILEIFQDGFQINVLREIVIVRVQKENANTKRINDIKQIKRELRLIRLGLYYKSSCLVLSPSEAIYFQEFSVSNASTE